jgi:hypothetical protein
MHAEYSLHHPCNEPTLAVEKQKRDDAYERWERGRKGRDRPKQPASREFESSQQKGERYADRE